jgi:molecular chaperone DnaK
MTDENLKVYGIDLGTTYSAIAYVDESGRTSVCRNVDNLETIPSVVYFEGESNVVVGSVAKDSAILHRDRVVSLIKRQMGTSAVFDFDGVTYTPESISALILKQLAQDAASFSGSDVVKVVVTVPAYFGMLEKDATKNAGKIAGLDVIGIVPEPVAAALHYEATTGATDKTVLVYDLGGGTFDTTVIKVAQDRIQVVCTDGDDRLGGADWDARLRDHLLAEFTDQVPPDTDPESDEEFLQSLSTIAENTKKQLSNVESRPVALRGAGVSARIDVTRAQFEEMTKDLLDKSIDVVHRTLATLEQKEPGAVIDEVLLVGGSTSMPAVKERLHAEFGWDAQLHDPHLAVAKGAALYALGRVVHTVVDDARQQAGSADEADRRASDAVKELEVRTGIAAATLSGLDKETQNVLPKAFGVKLFDLDTDDYYVEHLVHANDTLPITDRRLSAATVAEGQRAIEVELYEQSGAVPGPAMTDNKFLNDGQDTITGLPPLPKGSPVDIAMSVDDEGLLTVSATEPSTGKDLTIKVRVSLMSSEEVTEAASVVSALTVKS